MATNSLPEPPLNVPRIVDVQDPGTGHYVVMVRMPTNLATKWPDKPWGTAISAIGLSSKDSDLYPDYTLVDVEPVKGSADLYWIFQKLDGPEWTAKSKGQGSLVPAKYRRLITTTETKQEVDPATEPDDIVAPLVSSAVEQQMDTGKALKVNTEQTIDVDGDPLVGQMAYEEREVADFSGELVDEGEPAESGLLIISSQVIPNGDGTSVKETVSVTEWTEHQGCEWDHELNTAIERTEQFVAPGEGIGEPFTTVRPVNKNRSLKIVETAPTAALDAYYLIIPGTHPADDLPNLESVDVAWNVSSSTDNGDSGGSGVVVGSSPSLGLKAESKGSASVSVDPTVSIVMSHRHGRMLPAEHHFFYMPLGSSGEEIIGRTGASGTYPGRLGYSRTITAIGMSASLGVSASVGQSVALSGSEVSHVQTKGNSTERGSSTKIQYIQIPVSTGTLTVNDTYDKTITAQAMANLTAGSNWPAMSNVAMGNLSVQGSVNGTGATGSEAPTGSYAVSVDANPGKWGYMRCHVKVVDYT